VVKLVTAILNTGKINPQKDADM